MVLYRLFETACECFAPEGVLFVPECVLFADKTFYVSLICDNVIM